MPETLPITDVPFNLNHLKAYLPFTHPIPESAGSIAIIDNTLRTTQDTCVSNGEIALSYITHLLAAIKEKLEQAKGNDRLTIDYLNVHANLLRVKLNNQFNYVKELIKKTPLNKKQYNLINQKIKSLYQSMDETFNAMEALLKTYHTFTNTPSADFKFRFYQQYLEVLFFKKHTSGLSLKSERQALGTRFCVSQMEALAATLNSHNYTMDLLLIKTRIESQINRNIGQAFKQLDALKEKLTELALDLNCPDELVHDYNNHTALAELALYSYQLNEDPAVPSIAFLQSAASAALNAEESICIASETHQAEMSWIVERILLSSMNRIKKDLEFANLDELKTLLPFANALKKLLPMLVISSTQKNTSLGKKFIDTYEGRVIAVVQLIQKKITLIKEAILNNEKSFDELKQRENEYQANADETLAQFTIKSKAKPAPRPTKQHPPQTRINHDATEKHTSKKEKKQEAQPTLAHHARQFFSSVSLGHVENLLETVEEKDYAEAMLYMGDHYLKYHAINNALSTYERAFQYIQLQPIVNEELLNAIKIKLEDTQQSIQKEIEKTQRQQAELKQSRDNLIIKFGLCLLIKEGAKKETLNLHNQENWDNIYKRGKDVFIGIGKKKEAMKKPLSIEARRRDALSDYLGELNIALNKSDYLMVKIEDCAAGEKVNFPRLSGQKSTLFNQKTQPNKKQTAAPLQKPTKK